MICDYCKQNTKETKEIRLDGVDDIYILEVCDKCYEILCDYFSPEEVERMLYYKMLRR